MVMIQVFKCCNEETYDTWDKGEEVKKDLLERECTAFRADGQNVPSTSVRGARLTRGMERTQGASHHT